MTLDTTIVGVKARRVWDSRGRPTIEAEVATAGGAVGRAIAPAGASKGSGEALDRRDGPITPDAPFGGLDVTAAVAGVNEDINARLRGFDAADQSGVDAALVQLDGTAERARLGGNALVAVSMATAHAAAAAAGVPLWCYLGGADDALLPLPEVQVFGGGAHAARRVDVQDFMCVAVGAATFAQALDWTAEVYRAAGRIMEEAGRLQGVADEGGFWPAFDSNEEGLGMLCRAIERAGFVLGEQVALSLDIAASDFGRDGRYSLARDGRVLDTGQMVEMLLGWISRYPIVSVEDPLAEDDPRGFQELTRRVGDHVQIVGDDLLVTNAGRVREAAEERWCSAVLVKPNQAGTLTEARAALDEARSAGWGALASTRSGETEDVTIVHLAVGWGVRQLKVGSFSRSERMAKWNEGLRIADTLTNRGAVPPRTDFPWGQP